MFDIYGEYKVTDKQGKQSIHGGIGWMNVVKSTIAAACGVQTNANRQRDFQQGKPVAFIIAGLVFVLVFILGMYGLVQLVLSLAAQNG
jgi:VIT1/CCC1 family predicted Fe2+/Mn2+ transporter